MPVALPRRRTARFIIGMPIFGWGERTGARAVVSVFAAWLSFYGLQMILAVGLGPRTQIAPGERAELAIAFAALWTVFSLMIMAWHGRVRRIATDVLAVIALHLPALVALIVIDGIVWRFVTSAVARTPPASSLAAVIVSYADFDAVFYVAIVIIGETLAMRRAFLARQRQTARLEASLDRARLDYLEAQLQPHFLFNSLGAVSELAFDSPEAASRVLRQLSAIFRSALVSRSDEVPLGEELRALAPYLDIQRIRFADWLTIDHRVDDDALDTLVPRFVLQPLIENAMRHGLSGRKAPGTIAISARIDRDTLIVRVSDDGAGLSNGGRTRGLGIGLANVRSRLAILYGDDDRLALSENPAGVGGTVAELRIPARRHRTGTQTRPLDVPPAAEERREPDGKGNAAMPLRSPALLRHQWIVIVGSWLICGTVWAQQSYTYSLMRHQLNGATWLSVAYPDMRNALLWGLLTPVVLAVARLFPIRKPRLGARALALFALGIVVTAVHVTLLEALSDRVLARWPTELASNFFIDFAIYSILVAIAHRGVFVDWVHAREAAAATLSRELAAMRDRATQLDAVPPILLTALDQISTTAEHDVARTEAQLTRLADYLRIAIECTHETGAISERRQQLDDALQALSDTGACTLPAHPIPSPSLTT